jgi:hypothetical protein
LATLRGTRPRSRCRGVRSHEDIDLARGIRCHVQSLLSIPGKPDRSEASLGTIPRRAVAQHILRCCFAIRRVRGLAITERNAR